MEATGLGPPRELIVSGSGLLEDGPAALAALTKRANRPTAALCYDDLAAIGLLAAAARAGMRVSGELPVVGFDNIAFGAYTAPPLTTVEQSTTGLGRAAVASCLHAFDGAPPPDAVLSGQLVVRESAGPPSTW